MKLLTIGVEVVTQAHWMPPMRLRKFGCEWCGLMAEHMTWSISGNGESRYAFMHIQCGYCFEQTNWRRAHMLKIEAYQQRKASSVIEFVQPIKQLKLARVAGL